MAQWAKVIAAKPDDQSSIPRTHLVDGELALQMSSDCHMSIYTYIRK